ncbi:MAG: hypothetical protein U9R14_00065 [Patescibacteria group bacterium]|nr:hypothetical protein [Patescibacteria group bacterium]
MFKFQKNVKYKLFITFLFTVSLSFFIINNCVARLSGDVIKGTGGIEGQAEELAGIAGFESSIGVGDVMALVIQAFLSVLGIIFVVLIIVAGYNWMTAGGEEEKVTKAKDMIKRAIIGLIIIVAAYAISYFVFKALSGTGGTGYQE